MVRTSGRQGAESCRGWEHPTHHPATFMSENCRAERAEGKQGEGSRRCRGKGAEKGAGAGAGGSSTRLPPAGNAQGQCQPREPFHPLLPQLHPVAYRVVALPGPCLLWDSGRPTPSPAGVALVPQRLASEGYSAQPQMPWVLNARSNGPNQICTSQIGCWVPRWHFTLGHGAMRERKDLRSLNI